MRENILERTTVDNIINLLQVDLEISKGSAEDYKQVRQGQLADLRRLLNEKLSPQDRLKMLNDIQDLESIVAEEHLQIGFKAGVKLMNELGKI